MGAGAADRSGDSIVTMIALIVLLAHQQGPLEATPPPAPPPPVATIRRRVMPLGDWQAWLSHRDYPKSALEAREQGTTGFRLYVGVDGRVARCEITSSSGSAALDARTCELLKKRARFSPAYSLEAKPEPGVWASRFRWQLPE